MCVIDYDSRDSYETSLNLEAHKIYVKIAFNYKKKRSLCNSLNASCKRVANT